ncbi:hypothetical protein [Streptomyces lydicus]|uniref:hypothetical protein n=1 Tax=Streptomyces lydicus TaxID=47763 RepID=UPI0036E5EE19
MRLIRAGGTGGLVGEAPRDEQLVRVAADVDQFVQEAVEGVQTALDLAAILAS